MAATTTRHVSPLSRTPGRSKLGKNRGDETTETKKTADVHNGLKAVWSKDRETRLLLQMLLKHRVVLQDYSKARDLSDDRSLREGCKEIEQQGTVVDTGHDKK